MPPAGGPPLVYAKYPDIYRHWSAMSQAAMNGPSPISPGERELLFAFAGAVAGCELVRVLHSEVAYAWGIEDGLLERLLDDFDAAPVPAPLRALLAYARKLMLEPTAMAQADADAVFAAGWDEQALHDAILMVSRAALLHSLIAGHGFIPMSREVARLRAKERVAQGYAGKPAPASPKP